MARIQILKAAVEFGVRFLSTAVGSQNCYSGVKEFIKTDAVGASRCAHHDARASVVDSVAAHDIVRDRPASAVHVDGSFVGGTGKWVGDKRDPELGISDRVPRNSDSGRGEDQNARRSIRGVGDG